MKRRVSKSHALKFGLFAPKPVNQRSNSGTTGTHDSGETTETAEPAAAAPLDPSLTLTGSGEESTATTDNAIADRYAKEAPTLRALVTGDIASDTPTPSKPKKDDSHNKAALDKQAKTTPPVPDPAKGHWIPWSLGTKKNSNPPIPAIPKPTDGKHSPAEPYLSIDSGGTFSLKKDMPDAIFYGYLKDQQEIGFATMVKDNPGKAALYLENLRHRDGDRAQQIKFAKEEAAKLPDPLTVFGTILDLNLQSPPKEALKYYQDNIEKDSDGKPREAREIWNILYHMQVQKNNPDPKMRLKASMLFDTSSKKGKTAKAVSTDESIIATIRGTEASEDGATKAVDNYDDATLEPAYQKKKTEQEAEILELGDVLIADAEKGKAILAAHGGTVEAANAFIDASNAPDEAKTAARSQVAFARQAEIEGAPSDKEDGELGALQDQIDANNVELGTPVSWDKHHKPTPVVWHDAGTLKKTKDAYDAMLKAKSTGEEPPTADVEGAQAAVTGLTEKQKELQTKETVLAAQLSALSSPTLPTVVYGNVPSPTMAKRSSDNVYVIVVPRPAASTDRPPATPPAASITQDQKTALTESLKTAQTANTAALATINATTPPLAEGSLAKAQADLEAKQATQATYDEWLSKNGDFFAAKKEFEGLRDTLSTESKAVFDSQKVSVEDQEQQKEVIALREAMEKAKPDEAEPSTEAVDTAQAAVTDLTTKQREQLAKKDELEKLIRAIEDPNTPVIIATGDSTAPTIELLSSGSYQISIPKTAHPPRRLTLTDAQRAALSSAPTAELATNTADLNIINSDVSVEGSLAEAQARLTAAKSAHDVAQTAWNAKYPEYVTAKKTYETGLAGLPKAYMDPIAAGETPAFTVEDRYKARVQDLKDENAGFETQIEALQAEYNALENIGHHKERITELGQKIKDHDKWQHDVAKALTDVNVPQIKNLLGVDPILTPEGKKAAEENELKAQLTKAEETLKAGKGIIDDVEGAFKTGKDFINLFKRDKEDENHVDQIVKDMRGRIKDRNERADKLAQQWKTDFDKTITENKKSSDEAHKAVAAFFKDLIAKDHAKREGGRNGEGNNSMITNAVASKTTAEAGKTAAEEEKERIAAEAQIARNLGVRPRLV